ncbi:MAG TPA: histidine kinase [Anaerolineae bacterium]
MASISPFRKLRGLRVQLLLWTILPLAIVLILLSFVGVYRHRQAMQQLVEQRDRGLVLASATMVASTVQSESALLATAAGMIPATADVALAPSGIEREHLIARLGDHYAQGLALFDGSGQAQALAGGQDWVHLPGAQAAVRRALSVGLPQYASLPPSAASPAPTPPKQEAGGAVSDTGTSLLIAVPAPGSRVLAGLIPLERLSIMGANQHMQMETGGGVMLLDPNGGLIYAANVNEGSNTLQEMTKAVPARDLKAGHAASGYVGRSGGGNLLLAWARVDPPGWILVNSEDMSHMSDASMSIAEVLPIALLFVAVLALLAVSFGMASIVRPLQDLDRRAARVAWGEFDAIDTPVGGVQEIDDLRATLAQMAARIRAYQGTMRDYLSATTQAQEEERARLAHELHDDTVQALIALKQRAQLAAKVLGSDPGRASARLDELTQLIDQELTGLRRLIGDLRPIYLEDLGYVPALEMLARQTEERFGLEVDLQVKGEPVRLAPDVELAAFRIVQQAVRNVVTHAGAHRVKLEAVYGDKDLTLIVEDDGRGFIAPEQPVELARAGHFGIMGMRERAMLYGGYLNVVSAPGQGTTITACLPAC